MASGRPRSPLNPTLTALWYLPHGRACTWQNANGAVVHHDNTSKTAKSLSGTMGGMEYMLKNFCEATIDLAGSKYPSPFDLVSYPCMLSYSLAALPTTSLQVTSHSQLRTCHKEAWNKFGKLPITQHLSFLHSTKRQCSGKFRHTFDSATVKNACHQICWTIHSGLQVHHSFNVFLFLLNITLLLLVATFDPYTALDRCNRGLLFPRWYSAEGTKVCPQLFDREKAPICLSTVDQVFRHVPQPHPPGCDQPASV